MYGNLYVSGCVSSEASATANSPLLTTSTVTTGTLNQPQPQSPSGTVATAPLQSHRDAGPHLAGNEACLCSSCHIKDSFFPRSHDGSIVLPHPSLSVHPVRLPRPTASAMTNVTPLATPSVVPRKRHRAESTPSNHDLRLSVAKFNEGRHRSGSGTQNERRKRSSTEVGRTPANTGDSFSHRTGRKVISTDEPLQTPQMARRDEPGGHPFSGPSKRFPLSKKHDHKPNPWPRNVESAGQPIYQQSSPQHSHSLDDKSQLELSPDKHGIVARPQTPLAQELSPKTTKLEIARSTTPFVAPPSHTGAYGSDHHLLSCPPQGVGHMSIAKNYVPEPSGRPQTASRPECSNDAPQGKPKIIKFSIRTENPQPDKNLNLTPTSPSAVRSVNSSPTRPSSSSQFQEGSSHTFQTQFRFQEPITSPTRPRDLSIVQVKWDSERKRRQGYFAQEEGAEKSPFRHYNKANCDFEG